MIFDRIVCGVDASEESLVAARQAARLVSDGGKLTLIAIAEVDIAVHAGWAASALLDQLRSDAEEAVEQARAAIAQVENVEARVVDGPLLSGVRAAIEQDRATLVCVGTHGHGRVAGMVLGSLPTELLHGAPCSVLVARPSAVAGQFPSAIVAGVDGSQQAEAARSVAADLAGRFGGAVRVVVAGGGKGVDADAVRRSGVAVEIDPGKPVDVLVAASGAADLLVLGSRGLHGVRAVGSVSERAAHHAQCSVLVVR
jgi:nucleotide-binding universal stress UspA family protein